MATFLSADWLDAMDDAARASAALAEASTDIRLVVEQRVTGTPDGEVVFHLVLDHGEVRVHAGPADAATVSFAQDLGTARAIASGAGSAQRAFMAGTLRVGGDLRVLLERQDVLAGLADVFREVREASGLDAAG